MTPTYHCLQTNFVFISLSSRYYNRSSSDNLIMEQKIWCLNVKYFRTRFLDTVRSMFCLPCEIIFHIFFTTESDNFSDSSNISFHPIVQQDCILREWLPCGTEALNYYWVLPTTPRQQICGLLVVLWLNCLWGTLLSQPLQRLKWYVIIFVLLFIFLQ